MTAAYRNVKLASLQQHPTAETLLLTCCISMQGIIKSYEAAEASIWSEEFGKLVGQSIFSHFPLRLIRRLAQAYELSKQTGAAAAVDFEYAASGTSCRLRAYVTADQHRDMLITLYPQSPRVEPDPAASQEAYTTHRQAHNLQLIRTLQRTHYPDRESMVQHHVRLGCQMLGMRHGYFTRMTPDGFCPEFVHSPREAVRSLLQRTTQDPLAQKVTSRQGKLMGQAHAPTDTPAPEQSLYTWSSFAGIPVTWGGRSEGVLLFFDDRPAHTGPAPHEMELLELLADSMSDFLTTPAPTKRRREGAEPLPDEHQSFINAISDGIALHTNGKIFEVNQALATMLGYAPQELNGKRLDDVLTDTLPLPSEDGGASSFETKGITRTGQLFDMSVTTSPYQHQGQMTWLSIFRNISEQKHNEALLRRNQEAAEALLEAKEQFVSMVIHELRTPLNTVVGMTHLLLDETLTPTQLEYLNAIRFSSGNMLSLINDMLDFSKIEAGKITFENHTFHVHELLQDIRKALLLKAKEKHLALTLQWDERIPSFLEGDSMRLNQVLTNLISNAIKFTEEGAVDIKVELLAQKKRRIALRFSVCDTGIGISEDQLDAIFESYQQASADTSRKYGGTGLGLAICRKLVELQGGHIGVKSTFGVGSEFSFELTFTVAENQVAPAPAETTGISPLGDVRVLMVEDNQFNRLVASRFMEKWQVQADLAENGFEALEKLQTQVYDLVMMDIHMPGINGYETARRIRQHENPAVSQVPIIAMSASATTDIEQDIRQVGMNGCVSKPFDPRELYETIGRYAPQATPAALSNLELMEEKGSASANAIAADFSYLETLSGDNPDFAIRALEMFSDQMHTFGEQLVIARDQADRDIYRFYVHKLKSAYGSLRIKEYRDITGELETVDLSEIDFKVIKKKIAQLLNLNKRVIVLIKQKLEELKNTSAGRA